MMYFQKFYVASAWIFVFTARVRRENFEICLTLSTIAVLPLPILYFGIYVCCVFNKITCLLTYWRGVYWQVSELLRHIAPDRPEAKELARLLQCHHFMVRNTRHHLTLSWTRFSVLNVGECSDWLERLLWGSLTVARIISIKLRPKSLWFSCFSLLFHCVMMRFSWPTWYILYVCGTI